MNKLHLCALATLMAFQTPAYAGCDTCITQRELIDSTPTQLVAKLEALGKRADISIIESTREWDGTSNSDWAVAYTPDKVSAVIDSFQRSYTSTSGLTSIVPHVRYLATANTLYNIRHVAKVEQTPSWMSESIGTIFSQFQPLAVAVLNDQTSKLPTFVYGNNDGIAVYEILRLGSFPATLDIAQLQRSMLQYGDRAANKPLTGDADTDYRLIHLSTVAAMIRSSISDEGDANDLTKISSTANLISSIGAAVVDYGTVKSSDPFYTSRSKLERSEQIVQAVSDAVAYLPVDAAVWTPFISKLTPMSDYHLYTVAKVNVGNLNCQSFTVLPMCASTVIPNIQQIPSITRDHITVYGNVPDHYKLHLTDQMLAVHGKYMDTFNHPSPVANDPNEKLKVYIYRSRTDYIANQILVNKLPWDNGGFYVEDRGTMYTFLRNSDAFIEQDQLHTEELVRHEYVHWLNGRYLIPGNFGQSSLYSNEQLTAVDEGLANLFAGSSATAINVIGSMVQSYQQLGIATTIQSDLSVKYQDTGTYPRSAIAMSYAHAQGKLLDLATVLRAEDGIGLLQWKSSFDDVGYVDYKTKLTPMSRPWQTPFIGRGIKTSASYTNSTMLDIVSDFVKAGATSVDCTVSVQNRYNCKMDKKPAILTKLVGDADFINAQCNTDTITNCTGQYRSTGQYNALLYTIQYNGPTTVSTGQTFDGQYSIKMLDEKPLIFRLSNASINVGSFKYIDSLVTFNVPSVPVVNNISIKMDVLYGSELDSVQEYQIPVNIVHNPQIVQTGSSTVSAGSAYNIGFTAGSDYTISIVCTSGCIAGSSIVTGTTGSFSGTWNGTTSTTTKLTVNVLYGGNIVKTSEHTIQFNAPSTTAGTSKKSGGSFGLWSLILLLTVAFRTKIQ